MCYNLKQMEKKISNKHLNKANLIKNDEFYTQLSDIEKELCHYKEHFRNKVVFCNCDDPEESNFWKYFALNFEFLERRKKLCCCFSVFLFSHTASLKLKVN